MYLSSEVICLLSSKPNIFSSFLPYPSEALIDIVVPLFSQWFPINIHNRIVCYRMKAAQNDEFSHHQS